MKNTNFYFPKKRRDLLQKPQNKVKTSKPYGIKKKNCFYFVCQFSGEPTIGSKDQ